MNFQQVIFASLTCAAMSILACGSTDDSTASIESDLDDIAQFRSGRRHHPDGGSGGTSGGSSGDSGTGGPASGTGGSSAGTGAGGGDVGCDLCTKANACCNAVSGGPLCTFSSATCSSLDAAARPGYVTFCRMLLNTVFSTWNSKPPAACL